MGMYPMSHVFLRKSYEPWDSATVDEILRSVCPEIQDTRKGRHWEGVTQSWACLTVHVYKTEEHLLELEEELLDLDLLPEDAPDCIVIQTSLRTPEDLALCQKITELLQKEFDCKTSGARLR